MTPCIIDVLYPLADTFEGISAGLLEAESVRVHTFVPTLSVLTLSVTPFFREKAYMIQCFSGELPKPPH